MYENSNDETDDDSLPELFASSVSSTSFQNPARKSMEQLLQDTISLSKECKIDRELEQATRTSLENFQLKDSPEISESSPTPSSTIDMTEEHEFKLFCSTNFLQFFNLRDISLQSCGYSSKDLTEFEKLLVSTAPVKLENILSTILSICSSSICIETCINQVKPLVYYLLKILSVHEKEITVQACERALKSVLDCQSGISFSSSEMFVMLFNYGVELDDLEVLASNSKIAKPSKSYSCLSGIPSNWLYNLERLLSVIKDLIFALSFSNDDLLLLIKYFLFTNLDTLIQCESLVSLQLKNCLVEALNALSEDEWPGSFSDISKFVLSSDKNEKMKKWSHIYSMIKFIPDWTKRGSEIRKYVSISSLKILSGCDIEKEPSFLDIEYNVSDLLNILSNQSHLLQTYKMNCPLSIVVKFIDICIQHLILEYEEEYKDLFSCLKSFEFGISAATVTESTLNEEDHLIKIHTRLQLMKPDKKSDLVPDLSKIKIERNYNFEQNVPFIHSIKSETSSDYEQSVSNDMFLPLSPIENKINSLPSSSDLYKESISNSFNSSNEENIQIDDINVQKKENATVSISSSNEILHSVKENIKNDDIKVQEKETIENPIKHFIQNKEAPTNDPVILKFPNKTSKNLSISNSDFSSDATFFENIKLEKKKLINEPFNIMLVTDKTPILNNLQTYSHSNNDFNSRVKITTLGEKETIITENEIMYDDENSKKVNAVNDYWKNKASAIDYIKSLNCDKVSTSLLDDKDDSYSKNYSALPFNTDFEKESSVNPSVGANELNVFQSTKFSTSVRTLGNDSNFINIEINSPQSVDQTTDIHVRFSTTHVKSPENVNKNSSLEVSPLPSVPSIQKVVKDSIPDVCMIVKDKDKNEVIVVSDDDDDEIQIVSINSNSSNLPTLQKAQSNISKKAIKHHPSQVSTKMSSQSAQSLFNFFEPSPRKKFKSNDTAETNIPVSTSKISEVARDIMIIDNSSDDDCKIISDEDEVVLLLD